MASDLPFMKFFTRDWMADERLQLVSHAAKGVWIDILCLMHSSGDRGRLVLQNGKPYSIADIARCIRIKEEDAKKLIDELIVNGVASTDKAGVLVSRRMMREENLRRIRSESAKKTKRIRGELSENQHAEEGCEIKDCVVCYSKTEAQMNETNTSKLWNMGSGLCSSESKFMSGDGGVGEGVGSQKENPPQEPRDVIPIGQSNRPPKREYAQGCHFEEEGEARKVARFYLEMVKTTNTNIGDQTTNAIAQAMVEDGVTAEELKNGIRRFAAQLDAKKAEPDKRLSPFSFFTKGFWRDHIGQNTVPLTPSVDAKRQQEREQEARQTAEYRRLRGLDKKSAAS